MKRITLVGVLSLAIAPTLTAQAPPRPIVITNATVIDGVAAEPVRGATVVVRDGKIERIVAGRGVAAHAHGDQGAAAAVRAGVRTIEHGTYLSDETLTLMKARGTCFVPTIGMVTDLIDPGGDYDNPVLSIRGRAMLPRVRDAARRASRMGVKVIAGTDTDYGPRSTHRLADEVAELVQAGMSPMDAIKAATSVAAQCLGVDQRTGALKPGLEADLIAVDRDPLADIGALRDIVLLVNNGRVAINRLAP